MTSRYQPPPIMRSIERLLADVVRAVTTFNRKWRYDLGRDVHRQAMKVFHLANRACRDRARQARWVEDLVWAVDDLRALWQTAKLVEATRSFRQFEFIVLQIDEIGRQCGGWSRKLSPMTRNARGEACAQCGQKLSTRAASTGANT